MRPSCWPGASPGSASISRSAWFAPEVSILWRFCSPASVMLGDRGGARRSLALSRCANMPSFALLGLMLFCAELPAVLPRGGNAAVWPAVDRLLARLVHQCLAGRRCSSAHRSTAASSSAAFSAPSAWRRCSIRSSPAPNSRRGAVGAAGLCVAGTLAFCFGNMLSARLQRRRSRSSPPPAMPCSMAARRSRLYAAVRGHAFTVEWTPAYLGRARLSRADRSVIAFACYLTLLGRIGADRAAYVTVLGPVVALAVSTLVENFHGASIALLGLAAVLAGNLLVLRPAKIRALNALFRRLRRFRQVVERRNDVLGQRVGERRAFMRIAHEADAAIGQFRKAVGGRQHAHARPQRRFRHDRDRQARTAPPRLGAGIRARIEHAMRPPELLQAFERDAAPRAALLAERQRQRVFGVGRMADRSHP